MADEKIWKLSYGFNGLYSYAYKVGCMCSGYTGQHYHLGGTQVAPTHVEDANGNIYPFDLNKNENGCGEYLEAFLGKNTNDVRQLIGAV